MPEPEYGPEQELGPKLADAFQAKADSVPGPQGRGMAAEARRRIRKRRQTLVAAAAAVVVVVAIGGVWSAIGGPAPVSTSASDSSGEAVGDGSKNAPSAPGQSACPELHPILQGDNGGPTPGSGLDLAMPVYGLQACRYRLTPGATMLLGSGSFNASTAQQIVDAIKVLPERNPDLPVFRCAPAKAHPSEAIVLRFDTGLGVREIWVQYDGCGSVGFLTGSRTYGLYPAPLKLFLKGTLRPTGGIYLDHLKGW
jgi:hypothetical protein